MARRYLQAYINKSIFSYRSFNQESSEGPSQAYENFSQAHISQLREELREIEEVFESDIVNVHLEDGTEIICTRNHSRPKDEIDLMIDEITHQVSRCGIFSCKNNDLEGEQTLFLNNSPVGGGEAYMLNIGLDGFYNGPPISSITVNNQNTPLIALDNNLPSLSEMAPYESELTTENYVPENLDNQSDFFINWNSTSFERRIRSIGNLCKDQSWEPFNTALEAFEEQLAEAELVQYITTISDLLSGQFLTGHFIPRDQIPANACVEAGVFYNPDSYLAARELLPSHEGHAITHDQASRLFDEARNMEDIAWNYVHDGCYARAHLMARRFEEQGVHVDKAWLNGDLLFEQEDGTNVHWRFHVTPIVYVEEESGEIVRYAIDPSTFDRPVPVEVWAEALSVTEQIETTRFPFPQNTNFYNRNALAFSNSAPYLPNDEINQTEEQKLEMAYQTMQMYLGVQ